MLTSSESCRTVVGIPESRELDSSNSIVRSFSVFGELRRHLRGRKQIFNDPGRDGSVYAAHGELLTCINSSQDIQPHSLQLRITLEGLLVDLVRGAVLAHKFGMQSKGLNLDLSSPFVASDCTNPRVVLP